MKNVRVVLALLLFAGGLAAYVASHRPPQTCLSASPGHGVLPPGTHEPHEICYPAGD